MFLGHFGLGFAAKPAQPTISLGVLFAACQFADLLWPTLLLLGLERVEVMPGATSTTPLDFVSYPYSHSLLMLCAWGMLWGVAYYVLRRASLPAAVTVGLLVVSHWLLDLVVHKPDLPLTPWGTARFGLGLWNSLPATLAVELVVFAAGVGIYARSMRARTRAGSVSFWLLIAFLLIVYLATVFGPPPPTPAAIAWSAQAMWLIVAWGYFVDRSRSVDGTTRSAR